jgi:hypothetical protein
LALVVAFVFALGFGLLATGRGGEGLCTGGGGGGVWTIFGFFCQKHPVIVEEIRTTGRYDHLFI